MGMVMVVEEGADILRPRAGRVVGTAALRRFQMSWLNDLQVFANLLD
jgi:hypothetical protein